MWKIESLWPDAFLNIIQSSALCNKIRTTSGAPWGSSLPLGALGEGPESTRERRGGAPGRERQRGRAPWSTRKGAPERERQRGSAREGASGSTKEHQGAAVNTRERQERERQRGAPRSTRERQGAPGSARVVFQMAAKNTYVCFCLPNARQQNSF